MEAGVILKGRWVLISDSMTDNKLIQLHVGHLGIEKTHRLAWESVYWTHMNDDIERVCRSCSVCVEHQDANPKKPLNPHKAPSKPRQSLASDLFEINGRDIPSSQCWMKCPCLCLVMQSHKRCKCTCLYSGVLMRY